MGNEAKCTKFLPPAAPPMELPRQPGGGGGWGSYMERAYSPLTVLARSLCSAKYRLRRSTASNVSVTTADTQPTERRTVRIPPRASWVWITIILLIFLSRRIVVQESGEDRTFGAG